MNEIVKKKAEKLEALCPGVSFLRTITDNKIHFYAPSNHGGIHPYIVDLAELGISAEKWFDDEIARRIPSENDGAYNILCCYCGKVQIGLVHYTEQVSLMYSPWICPRCGNKAEFDDDVYMEYWDNKS